MFFFLISIYQSDIELINLESSWHSFASTRINIPSWSQHPSCVKKTKRISKIQSWEKTVPFTPCLERRHLGVEVSVLPLIRDLSRFVQIKIQRALNGHWRRVSNYCERISHLPRGGHQINGSLLKGAFGFILLLSQTQPALWSASLGQEFSQFNQCEFHTR